MVQVGGNITICLPNEFESLKTKDIFENLINFLEELKPLNIDKDNISLAPFILGFFKYWGNDIKIGGEEFEVQCEKDLDIKWREHVGKPKTPDCLLNRNIYREVLNIDLTWVPKNSGPYYKEPYSNEQILPSDYPLKSYIYLAVEHAENYNIVMKDSKMGTVLAAIRKLGYIKSLFKIVIYKPFKNETYKTDLNIQKKLELIQKEIKLTGLHQEKEKTDTWFIIMLFNYYEGSSIIIGKKDLFLRGYTLDNTGEVISNDEDSEIHHEYKITGFYA